MPQGLLPVLLPALRPLLLLLLLLHHGLDWVPDAAPATALMQALHQEAPHQQAAAPHTRCAFLWPGCTAAMQMHHPAPRATGSYHLVIQSSSVGTDSFVPAEMGLLGG